MSEYLLEIKGKVVLIVAFRLPILVEDVIYYILNGLPASHNNFKSVIQRNLQSISLDDLYSFLCSEEVLISREASKKDHKNFLGLTSFLNPKIG